MKIQFETFKNISDSYTLNQLKKESPCNINFLEYKKYRVTIELVEEPKEVLIERLQELMQKEGKGYTKRERILKEIKKIKDEI